MLFLKLSEEVLVLLITATILMTTVDLGGILNFCLLLNKSLHSHSEYEILRLNFLMENARRSSWFGGEYCSKKKALNLITCLWMLNLSKLWLFTQNRKSNLFYQRWGGRNQIPKTPVVLTTKHMKIVLVWGSGVHRDFIVHRTQEIVHRI